MSGSVNGKRDLWRAPKVPCKDDHCFEQIDDLRPSEGLHGLIQQRAPRLQQRRIPGVSVAKPRLAVAEDECQLRPLRLLESLLLPTSAVVDSADSATAITDIFCSARGPGS